MYLVALVLAAVAYETGYGTLRGAEHHPGQSVFAWLLMLPNLLTGPNVPNVTWTLSYEMVFYLLLVALFSWGVHRHSGGYAPAFAVGAVALGGVLPMAALTHWAGHADHGGLALNADRRRAGPRRHRRRGLVAVPGGPGRGGRRRAHRARPRHGQPGLARRRGRGA